ncbi:MAG TPA: AbfB domain-containing protein, partial [Kofleriaceae bacterium]|nr:AbfB domain-containing protein [Kofleriaceae bacterium]
IGTGAPEGIAAAEQVIASQDAQAAQTAITALASASTPDARRVLQRAIASTEPEVRRSALQALAQAPDADSEPVLAGLCSDGDASVRQLALAGLAAVGTPSALEWVVSAAEQGPPDERAMALGLLGGLGGSRAAEVLRRALRDPDPRIATAAGQNFFALKDGNARTGGLATRYSGALPTTFARGYSPMHQEGSIVLGTGGDNSNGAIGNFFEGAMTAGVPSDATENAVQANIVSVNYGGPSPVAAGTLTPGSTISLRATTACCTTRFARHQNGNVVTSVITSTSVQVDKDNGTFIVRRGLANNACVSFESRDFPGDFLRHQNFQLHRQPNDGSALFRADATFCPQAGMNGQGTSFASFNFPTRFIRHFNNTLFIASNGGTNNFDTATSWADDVSWIVTSPFTP